MSEDSLEELKRKQAQLAAEAEAVAREIEQREFEEFRRLAAKFNVPIINVTPVPTPSAAPPTVADTPAPAPQGQRSAEPTKSAKTIADLVRDYRAGTAYAGLRFKTRETYDMNLNRILQDRGGERLADLKLKDLQGFYATWTKNGTDKIARGHALMTMLRILFSFGVSVQDDNDCVRLQVAMHNLRFKTARSRNQALTTEQALALINKAHEMGMPSIALAQAFQVDLQLNQKDVIGEWIPADVDGPGYVVHDGMKWGRGLRWEEIDADFILRHTLSSRGNLIQRDLTSCPNVVEQLKLIYGAAMPGVLPKNGPMIIREVTSLPWPAHEFRRQWRRVATACEIPEDVRNMDISRRSATQTGTGQKLKEDRLASSVLSREVH